MYFVLVQDWDGDGLIFHIALLLGILLRLTMRALLHSLLTVFPLHYEPESLGGKSNLDDARDRDARCRKKTTRHGAINAIISKDNKRLLMTSTQSN